MKNRKSIFKVLLTLFLLWFFGHVLYITIDGLSDNGGKSRYCGYSWEQGK